MLPCVRVAPTDQVIAQFLRMRRDRKQLVVAGLAEHLGISGEALSPMFKGKRGFPMKHLDGVADFYKMDVIQLIETARREVAEAEEEEHRLRILEARLPPEPDEEDTNGGDT